MDNSIINKIITNATRYFPIPALFYILDKTNEPIVLSIFLFSIFIGSNFDLILKKAKSKVNIKEKELLISLSKENEALDRIIKEIEPKKAGEILINLAVLISILFLNVYSIVWLVDLREYNSAKALLIIGSLSLIAEMIRFIYHLWRNLKNMFTKN